VRAYNFGNSVGNITKFYQVTWREAGVIVRVQLLEGVPTTKFGKAKNVQNSAQFLTTFDLNAEHE